MAIAQMIRDQLEELTREFAAAAQSQVPAAAALDAVALEDSVRDILQAMAGDLESLQSASHQADKSHGLRPHNAPQLSEHAHLHAARRLEQGFTLDDLVSEFRALRASLSRRLQSGATDLDELIRLNEAVDQALLESVRWYEAEVEHARKLFLGVFGHDLRTPLGAIMMSAEVILRDETLGSVSTVAAVRMKNSAQRMSRLIEDLIDFTRTRLGTRLPTRPEHVDLVAVVQQAVEELRASHPTRVIQLAAQGPVWGDWDPGRLAQATSNLLGNAIQYGDPATAVSARIVLDDSCVVLGIHNMGAPIAPEAIAHVFEPLARFSHQETDTLGHRPSIGLGLYIARAIARAHEGTIEVESSASQGTTFTIRLPREQRAPAA